MTSPLDSDSDLTIDSQDIGHRFIAQWDGLSEPKLASFVHSDHLARDERQGLMKPLPLKRLIVIDLQRRAAQAVAAKPAEGAETDGGELDQTETVWPLAGIVKSQLNHFEWLRDESEVVAELLAEEYRLRKEMGEQPSHEEYISTVENGHGVLLEMLEEIDRSTLDRPDMTVTFDSDSANRSPNRSKSQPTDADTHDPTVDPSPSTKSGQSGSRSSRRRRLADLPQENRMFGQYELLDEIARGGMGVVYKARQVRLNRTVAVKMILSGQFASDADVDRFYTEAEAAARLDHPGIVPIFEVGELDEQHFYSMAFVDGDSLSDRIASGPLASRDAAVLLKKVADAVQYAHQNGIIHRDLKPRNILLTGEGEPRVTDFGLAAKVEGDHELTATGQVLGTPSYMPPEQAAGRVKEVGPESDVYSLGAVLYCLLTARPPFQSSNVVETIKQVLESDPVPPRLLNPSVDRDLETICLKCLEKDQANRYRTAKELADELQRYLAGQPIHARRIGVIGRGWRWVRRKPTVAALAASVLVLAVAISFAVMVSRSALETRQLTELNQQFDRGLRNLELTEASLAEAEALAARYHELEPTKVEQRRQRLYDAFADLIKIELKRPKLAEADIGMIAAAIDVLETRDPTSVANFRSDLRRRQGEWQIVFRLQPPFENLNEVANGPWRKQDDGLVIGPGGNQTDLAYHLTRFDSRGHVQIQATFAEGWEELPAVGVSLNTEKMQAYDFVLTTRQGDTIDRSHRGKAVALPMKHVRTADGEFLMQIRRNGVPLITHAIHQSKIAPGPVQLRGSRQGHQLELQINSLPPHKFRDPFPLSTARPGYFALFTPPDTAVTDILAERKPRPEQASALEKGDELFDDGNYDAALAFYQQQELETDDVEFEHEARYKQAICLMQLNRLDDAVAILQPLMTEPDGIWPPLAACQLWMLRLNEGKMEEADAIFQTLASRFRFEQLAVLIPAELRNSILEAYSREMNTVSAILRYNPNLIKNIDRLVTIDRLLSPDGLGDPLTQIELSRAYRLHGNLDKALEICEQVIQQRPPDPTTLRHYLRLLRLTGKPQVALDTLNRHRRESENPKVRKNDWLDQEEAKIYVAMGNWDDCETIIDDQVARWRAGEDLGPDILSYMTLMKGFLLERRGAKSAARTMWAEGYRAVVDDMAPVPSRLSTGTINTLMLGSLSGALERQDAERFFTKVVTGGGENAFVRVVQSMLNPVVLENAMRNMWQSQIGKKFAQDIAFEQRDMHDRIRIPLALAGLEYFRLTGANGEFTPVHERVAFEILSELFEQLVMQGEFSVGQIAQLSLTWKGQTNFLGWGGVKGTLNPDSRAKLALLFANKYAREKNLEAAKMFFETAVRDGQPGSELVETAKTSLELLNSQQGKLDLSTDCSRPLSVVVRQDGEVVQTVSLDGQAELRLPVGDFVVEVDDPSGSLTPKQRSLKIAAGSQHIIQFVWKWAPDDQVEPLLGPIPRPAMPLTGGDRWQIYSRMPRVPVDVIAWSPDGESAALGCTDAVVRIIDPHSWEVKKLVPGFESALRHVAWHPDSQQLAAVDWSSVVSVIDVETGGIRQKLPIIAGHRFNRLAWSGDGRLLAAGASDGVLRVWNNLQGVVADFRTSVDNRDLVWHPDGQWLLAGGQQAGNGIVEVWDVEKGQCRTRLSFAGNPILTMAFSRDEQRLLVAGKNGEAAIVDVASWKTIESLPGEARDSQCAGWLPNDRGVVLIGANGRQDVWEFSDGQPTRETKSLSTGRRAAIKPDGTAFIATNAEHRLMRVNLGDWQETAIATERTEITALSVNTAADLISVASFDGFVRLLTTTGDLSHTFPQQVSRITAATWSPMHLTLAVGLANGDLVIWRKSKEEWQESRTKVGREVSCLAWNPTGDRIVVGGVGVPTAIWKVDPLEVEREFPPQDGHVHRVDWSAEGVIVTADARGYLRSWTADGTMIAQWQVAERAPMQIGFSPNGQTIASLSIERELQLFAPDGSPVSDVFRGTQHQELAFAWSPDGTRLVSSRYGGVLRFWDSEGNPGESFFKYAGRPMPLAWSGESDHIFGGSEDGVVRAWDAKSREEQWVTILTADGGTVKFSPQGQAFGVDSGFVKDFVYTVQNASAGFDMLPAPDFHAKFGLTWPPEEPAR